MSVKLIVFDLDGTLMESASGAIFPRTISDRQWIAGRDVHVRRLHEQGMYTALATNQGGAAFGIFRPEQMDAYLNRLAFDLHLSAWSVCYHHPNGRIPDLTGDHFDRKPHPGMLLKLMEATHMLPEDILFVGDREEDQQAAQAADVAFEWADDYFAEVDQHGFWSR